MTNMTPKIMTNLKIIALIFTNLTLIALSYFMRFFLSFMFRLVDTDQGEIEAGEGEQADTPVSWLIRLCTWIGWE